MFFKGEVQLLEHLRSCSLVPRPPHFFFVMEAQERSLLPCILNANQRTKNGGGLGTRLQDACSETRTEP